MSALKNAQVDQIAEFNHEVNRLFCRLFLKDTSEAPWGELDDFQKEGVKAGVRKAVEIYENKAAGPFGGYGVHPYSALHEHWMTTKLKAGWRYGLEKDTGAKVHPSLLPYNDLSIKNVMKSVFFYDNFSHLMSFQKNLQKEGKEKR